MNRMIRPERPLTFEEVNQKDMMGFRQLAPTLASNIACMEPPSCFGVFGSWGSGKTTLMRCIMGCLDPARRGETDQLHFEKKRMADIQGRKFVTVWLDTWLYDQGTGNDVCYALLRRIEQELAGKGHAQAEQFKALRKDLLVAGLALANGVARLATLGQCNPVEDVRNSTALVTEALRDEYDEWIDAAGGLRDRFTKAIDDGLTVAGAERLVVFLDDLDRCLPHNVVSILERLKNVFMAGRVTYVIGADRAAIVEAICRKYGYSQAYGERYLDKVVMLGYDLRQSEGGMLFMDAFEHEMADVLDRSAWEQTPPLDKRPDVAYSLLAEAGLGSPRASRKVAIKLAFMYVRAFGEAVCVEVKADTDVVRDDYMRVHKDAVAGAPARSKQFDVRGDYLRVFKDAADSATQAAAPVAIWRAFRTATAVSLLKESFPVAFGSFDPGLFEAIQILATMSRTGAMPASQDSLDALWNSITKTGLSRDQARRIGLALFRPHGDEPALTIPGLELIYRDLGAWL